MFEKVVEYGPETREKFLRGVNKVGEAVGMTMGPRGLSFAIKEKYRAPTITNDGVSVARRIVLEDDIEDLAAQTLVDVAMRTNYEAGDGTTTATVIAHRLINDAFERLKLGDLSADVNPIALADEIYAQRPFIVEKIQNLAKTAKKDDLYNVVATSLRDREYGKTIADMLKKVGVDGYISVEDNWETKRGVEASVIEGMKFLGTYATPYFANSANQKEAIWENSHILVTNHPIESTNALSNLLKGMQQNGLTKLVIISGFSEGAAFSKPFIATVANAIKAVAQGNSNALQVLGIKAPSLTTEELMDVSEYLGAKFIDKSLGHPLISVTPSDCGQAKKVVVDADDVHLIGGAGDASYRIETLKKQVEKEKDVMFRTKLEKRIASLNAAVGVIRVGAATESERTYLKYKIEDAVNAGRAALAEGVIQGGGVPLKEIAEELGKDHILYGALRAPFETIQRNCGGSIAIEPNVLDAAKVTRLAVENALSAAAQVITLGGAIGERPKTLIGELEKKLKPEHNADFRADENQDLGRGRV